MRNLLLISTIAMIPAVSHAGAFLNPTYIHTNTPIGLEPISQNLNAEIKLASVCFLGDNCGNQGSFNKGDNEMTVDSAKQCTNEGFVNSCSSGFCLSRSCPYNSAYGKCLAENCPDNSAVACTGAVTGKNSCGVECKQCCTASCPSVFSNYTAATIPNGYIQSGTETCDKCGIGKVVKITPNPCSGYLVCSNGPASGATSCLSGTTTKYSSCQPCYPSCTSTPEAQAGCPDYKSYFSRSDGCGGYCGSCRCYITKTCWTSCQNFEREEGVFCGEWQFVDYSSCGGTSTNYNRTSGSRRCQFGWNPEKDQCGKNASYMSSSRC